MQRERITKNSEKKPHAIKAWGPKWYWKIRQMMSELIRNCANLTMIFADILENCANHKANIANLIKISQT